MYELRLLENVTAGNTSQDRTRNRPYGQEFIMKSSLILNFGFLPPFFPPTQPLSRAQTLGMCLFLPCAVLLQFSHCCGFALLPVLLWADCSSACQGLGFLCAFFPPPPVFLPLFCLRVVCSPACFLPLLLFSPFFFPLLVVAGCPCSLPSPPPACV